MKVAILVTLIVLPMLTSIGLYCYAFASTRWSDLDERMIHAHTAEQQPVDPSVSPKNLQLHRQTIRHAFRSHYGLYGYCLDYRWISLLVPKPSASAEQPYRSDSTTLACRRCNDPRNRCPQNSCCMARCDTVPDCPSYDDEKDCNRPYNQTRYYWPKGNCMWQSTWIGNLPLPLDAPTAQAPPRDHHRFFKLVRHYLMLLLFVAAPLLTFVALLIMFCLNCVERFYSIPFAFVGFISLAAFVSGAGALGLFLYEWVHERFHRPEFAYEFKSDEALVLTLNPWLVEVERFGLAFWLIVAAVGTSLLTALLSCCFCCGLQSEKSKLRFHVDNDVYEIVQMAPYDE